ncbi:MAG: sulfotransferase family protein [Myxococcota bacterium]
MKLINVGLGRTGTTSLKGALDVLGFSPIYHTTDMFSRTKDIDLWEAALDGRPTDWSAFFAGYQVADWPAGLVYPQLLEAFPDAKVMMTVRDPHSWVDSIQGVMSKMESIKLPFARFKRAKAFMTKHAINGMFEGKIDDRAHMVKIFERHVESVERHVPKDKLLVYDVREGWEPLCRFLGVGVPDQPFPRLNKRGGFKDLAAKLFGMPD